MGLLDILSSDQGRMALGLLSAAGPTAQPMSTGQRLFGAMQQIESERQRKKQMEAEEQQRAMNARLLEAKLAETLAQVEQRKQGMANQQRRASYLDAIDPMRGPALPVSVPGALAAGVERDELPFLLPQPKEKPRLEKVGDSLVRINEDATSATPLFTAPQKQGELPPSVREFNFGRENPEFDEWLLRVKKAGGTNVNVPVKVETKMGESLASQVGPIAKETREQALNGVDLVNSSSRIMEAARQGNVFAGPLANQRLTIAQVGDMLGVTGANTAEKILNTRQAIQSIAEQAVKARAQLGGQAQISNFEQKTLEKATSPDISELTVPELKAMAALNKRLGQQLYERHQHTLKTMRSRESTRDLADMFDVPSLPKEQNEAPVRRYNPQTGRIE